LCDIALLLTLDAAMEKKRKNKNTGRGDFQIDLGLDLLNHGITLD